MPAVPSSKPVVLIVDDSRLIREILASALLDLVEVVAVEDVASARKVLREREVDVVIADHHLEGPSGLALLASLRDACAEPKRILVSGRVDAALAVEAVNRAEVFRLLEKPVDRDELRLAVLAAVDMVRREREDRRALAAVRTNPVVGALVGAEVARVQRAVPERPAAQPALAVRRA